MTTNTLAGYVAVELCADCALWAANRDDSGSGADWLILMLNHPHILAAVGAAIVTCTGKDHGRDCHKDFATAPCGGCGSRLSGDRCPALMPPAVD